MLQLPLLDVSLRTRNGETTLEVWDPVRRSWIVITPEEHVRQLLLAYLIKEMQYPSSLMAIERGLTFGNTILRYDIVVYHRDTQLPWMLVECKSPEIPLTDVALQQLLQYYSKVPECSYWLLTNGHQSFCAEVTDSKQIKWLDTLPAY